jgi:hypothetical protein
MDEVTRKQTRSQLPWNVQSVKVNIKQKIKHLLVIITVSIVRRFNILCKQTTGRRGL